MGALKRKFLPYGMLESRDLEKTREDVNECHRILEAGSWMFSKL